MQLHWRYLMARWAALPVVWAAAGEQIMPWYLSEQDEKDSAWLKHEWSTIIRYMRSINVFNRMITTHPQTTARNCVDDPSLLDFDMQQTDHRAPTFLQAARATEGWQSTPVMPVMNGESRYEALEITPKVTTANVRQAFWAHMLNSGCAGHTYGANGIWQANRDGEPFGKSPNGHNWGNTPWDTAMKLPGASQLSIAKELLLSLPWETLEPIALSASRWPKYVNYLMYFFQRHQQAVAAATTPNGRVALYYVLNLKPIILNMQYWTKPMNAVWFDPTNGSRVRVSSIPTNQTETFMCKPPGCNGANEKDWLLLITRA